MEIKDLVRGQRVKVTFQQTFGGIITTEYITFDRVYRNWAHFKYDAVSTLSIAVGKIKEVKQ